MWGGVVQESKKSVLAIDGIGLPVRISSQAMIGGDEGDERE